MKLNVNIELFDWPNIWAYFAENIWKLLYRTMQQGNVVFDRKIADAFITAGIELEREVQRLEPAYRENFYTHNFAKSEAELEQISLAEWPTVKTTNKTFIELPDGDWVQQLYDSALADPRLPKIPHEIISSGKLLPYNVMMTQYVNTLGRPLTTEETELFNHRYDAYSVAVAINSTTLEDFRATVNQIAALNDLYTESVPLWANVYGAPCQFDIVRRWPVPRWITEPVYNNQGVIEAREIDAFGTCSAYGNEALIPLNVELEVAMLPKLPAWVLMSMALETLLPNQPGLLDLIWENEILKRPPHSTTPGPSIGIVRVDVGLSEAAAVWQTWLEGGPALLPWTALGRAADAKLLRLIEAGRHQLDEATSGVTDIAERAAAKAETLQDIHEYIASFANDEISHLTKAINASRYAIGEVGAVGTAEKMAADAATAAWYEEGQYVLGQDPLIGDVVTTATAADVPQKVAKYFGDNIDGVLAQARFATDSAKAASDYAVGNAAAGEVALATGQAEASASWTTFLANTVKRAKELGGTQAQLDAIENELEAAAFYSAKADAAVNLAGPRAAQIALGIPVPPAIGAELENAARTATGTLDALPAAVAARRGGLEVTHIEGTLVPLQEAELILEEVKTLAYQTIDATEAAQTAALAGDVAGAVANSAKALQLVENGKVIYGTLLEEGRVLPSDIRVIVEQNLEAANSWGKAAFDAGRIGGERAEAARVIGTAVANAEAITSTREVSRLARDARGREYMARDALGGEAYRNKANAAAQQGRWPRPWKIISLVTATVFAVGIVYKFARQSYLGEARAKALGPWRDVQDPWGWAPAAYSQATGIKYFTEACMGALKQLDSNIISLSKNLTALDMEKDSLKTTAMMNLIDVLFETSNGLALATLTHIATRRTSPEGGLTVDQEKPVLDAFTVRLQDSMNTLAASRHVFVATVAKRARPAEKPVPRPMWPETRGKFKALEEENHDVYMATLDIQEIATIDNGTMTEEDSLPLRVKLRKAIDEHNALNTKPARGTAGRLATPNQIAYVISLATDRPNRPAAIVLTEEEAARAAAGTMTSDEANRLITRGTTTPAIAAPAPPVTLPSGTPLRPETEAPQLAAAAAAVVAPISILHSRWIFEMVADGRLVITDEERARYDAGTMTDREAMTLMQTYLDAQPPPPKPKVKRLVSALEIEHATDLPPPGKSQIRYIAVLIGQGWLVPTGWERRKLDFGQLSIAEANEMIDRALKQEASGVQATQAAAEKTEAERIGSQPATDNDYYQINKLIESGRLNIVKDLTGDEKKGINTRTLTRDQATKIKMKARPAKPPAPPPKRK